LKRWVSTRESAEVVEPVVNVSVECVVGVLPLNKYRYWYSCI